MRNRHYVFTMLLFFLANVLTSQGFGIIDPGSTISNLPAGAHVPGEVILHYDTPTTIAEVKDEIQKWIKSELDQCKNPGRVPFAVERIGDTRDDFLARFPNGFPCGQGTCTVIDPNGPIHSQVRANGTWPNYYISPGVDLSSDDCSYGTIGAEITDDRYEQRTPPTAPVYDALSSCTPAYSVTVPYGDDLVQIAVLDSGLDPTNHPDIFQGQTHSGEDEHGHGTAVTAIILHQAHLQNKHASVEVWPRQVIGSEGTGTLSDLMEELEKLIIKNEHEIIHMSLGYQPLSCDLSSSTAISDHLRNADQAGIFMVTSAGNSHDDLGLLPQYPAAESGLGYGITVGALECTNGDLSGDSSYGREEVDYLAPGENILVPRASDECFLRVAGTSFSAPVVTSMIAGYLSQGYTPEEVRCIMINGARPHNEATHSTYGRAAAANPPVPSCTDLPDDESPAEEDVIGERGLPIRGNGLRLFPNPVTDELRISLTKDRINTQGTLSILDAQGLLVLTSATDQKTQRVDVSQLPPGMYFVHYRSGEAFFVKRFLKH